MKKTRLGILGPGRIVSRVMTDMPNAAEIELTAVASRDPARARDAAKRYGAPLAFASYADLAACDQVDLVYIATPHPFHAQQAMLMMEHGKHVLCEKPMEANAAQTRRMIDCARAQGVFLMEAMWTRFFPATRKLMELIRGGAIGQVRHVCGEFSTYLDTIDPTSRLFDPALAGGALLDIGVYPLMAVTQLLGWRPNRVQGVCVKAASGVDMRTCVQLGYPNGATAQIVCGMDAQSEDCLKILGTGGQIVVPGFWHPTAFTVYAGGTPPRRYTFAPENEGHHYEFDHAAQCIRAGMLESPLMPLEESLAVSEICTRIRHDNGIFYPGEQRDA